METAPPRHGDREETCPRFSDEHAGFLKRALDNPGLHPLRKPGVEPELTDEQRECRYALFNMLVSPFERAYIVVCEDEMDRQTRRLWLSREDQMREWRLRKDFRDVLPELLKGEDEEFAAHIGKRAEVETARSRPS